MNTYPFTLPALPFAYDALEPYMVRTSVRNQGGGHSNHSLFWEVLKAGPAGEPGPKTAAALTKDFGGFGKFKESFDDAVVKLFGSGWVFLTLDPKNGGKCKLFSAKDHDTGISRGLQELMVCDVWEHAYYLKHQNRRADFLKSFWNVVNWDAVEAKISGTRI